MVASGRSGNPGNDALRRHAADEISVDLIDKLGIDEVVRTPLTCDTRGHGLCAACYGRDLGRGTFMVQRGRQLVGVIAAPVDRRTGYPADHADVPRRRCRVACSGC